jgi:hypothetical protein
MAWQGRSSSLLACTILAATLVLSGCAGAVQGGDAAPSSSAGTTSSASSKAIAAAESACGKQKDASGDIYVWMIQPGEAPVTQELGGEWVWNVTLSKCLTSVQMMIATAPHNPGTCTQVGYIADNPGYDPNGTPAAPLKHVVAQTGPAC